MFGRRKKRMNEYVGFYGSIFENLDWWRCDDPVGFNEASSLGKDVYGILQLFTRGDLVWIHIMVKHDAFQTFFKEMEKIRDQFKFPNRGRAKKSVKIQDPFHLAHAIVHVSQRKSGCDGRIPPI
ncbi:uncharacterized protein NPIL_366301 [Nephila pilipes]|uniref:Uncharacterized protein n=1 Tax=Nephila pilipes TaxID=299642 RepID=A0A8X6TW80_NEPPI|nr:uncharacterized protein NPIL_93051 [Nephila pilipes]GFT58138.1 uncharacterized protein NPIL_366301 [Nephila pilipes]